MLGAHIEIERKYIIRIPDVEKMRAKNGYSLSEITQIYLKSPLYKTHRIRSRRYCNRTEYTETVKVRIDGVSAAEDEIEISEERFVELSKRINTGSSPIKKLRHVFEYCGQIFEIDVYPQWKNTAIMETELESRDEKVEFPDFIEIVEEVTGRREYSNAAMSVCFPKETETID